MTSVVEFFFATKIDVFIERLVDEYPYSRKNFTSSNAVMAIVAVVAVGVPFNSQLIKEIADQPRGMGKSATKANSPVLRADLRVKNQPLRSLLKLNYELLLTSIAVGRCRNERAEDCFVGNLEDVRLRNIRLLHRSERR